MLDKTVRLVCCSARGMESKALESSLISRRFTSNENDEGRDAILLNDKERRWSAVRQPISWQIVEMRLWDRSMMEILEQTLMRGSTSLRRFCRRMRAVMREWVEKRE
jgi:hypothetical protein